ncbi:hypothetical protein LINGRAHAP2_LOCUS23432 [Linum grandiflorum]
MSLLALLLSNGQPQTEWEPVSITQQTGWEPVSSHYMQIQTCSQQKI